MPSPTERVHEALDAHGPMPLDELHERLGALSAREINTAVEHLETTGELVFDDDGLDIDTGSGR